MFSYGAGAPVAAPRRRLGARDLTYDLFRVDGLLRIEKSIA